jgi:hypothetical protein
LSEAKRLKTEIISTWLRVSGGMGLAGRKLSNI